jgi:hypothetical protein
VVGPRLVWTLELGEDPSERSLPGDVRLGRVDKDRHQQRRDTMSAGDADQTAQLALKNSWSMCREPVGHFAVWHRLRLVVLGAVSWDG